jgi:meiotic recombination protein SPO11
MQGRVYASMTSSSEQNSEVLDHRDHMVSILENLCRRTLLAILTQGIAGPIDQMTRITMNGVVVKREEGRTNQRSSSPFNTPAKLRTMAQTVYLLNVIHELVVSGRQVTQRELFYRSLAGGSAAPFFAEQSNLNKALLTLMDAIGCERHELGVFTTARGFVCADAEVETVCLDEEGVFLCDLSAHRDGLSISEQLTHLSTIQTTASCVLIVEKDTVFQSLISSACNFFQTFPCILVTARGYPDNVTIRFLNRLRRVVGPQFPLLYLGDLDPHGICIYLTYWRALDQSIEWIGVHYEDIGPDYNQHSLLGLKLKPSDVSLIKSLMDREGIPEKVVEQLEKIKQRGLKYEVECLHSLGESFLASVWLPSKLQSFTQTTSTSTN